MFQERPIIISIRKHNFQYKITGVNIQHSSRTARPVAVVEIKALALQDEGAHAVLWRVLVSEPYGGQICRK